MEIQLDERIRAVFDALHERRARESELANELSREEFGARIDEFMLPVGPEAGAFLYLLAISAGASRFLELGTSVGYSTLWMAAAARRNGGHVTSLDTSANKTAQAQDNLAQAGLAERVTCHTTDALAYLAGTDERYDFVLIDIWKDMYVPSLEAVAPLLLPGGIILADNMTFPESAQQHAQAYRARVQSMTDFDSMLVPIGNGLEFSRRRP
jgi:predicted O-methyltransferase YrrM